MSFLNKYYFLDELILRVPLNPMNSDDKTDPIKYFASAERKETLYLASKILHDRIFTQKKKELDVRTIVKALKYKQRSMYRCTPFGLFSSVGVAKWSPNENNGDFNRNKLFRKTSLDMSITLKIIEELTNIKEIRDQLKFYSNPTCFYLDKKVRYLEPYTDLDQRKYRLSQVESSSYLEAILERTINGTYLEEIYSWLTNKGVINYEAREFIKELVDNKLLISEFSPHISDIPLEELVVSRLKSLNLENSSALVKDKLELLESICKELVELDSKTWNDLQSYETIIQQLSAFQNLSLDQNIFQVNAYSTCDNIKIKTAYQKNLLKALDTLTLLQRSKKSKFDNFVEKFKLRYDSEMVPLMTALDPEYGIGYSLNMNQIYLENNQWIKSNNREGNSEKNILLNISDQFLLRKLISANTNGKQVVTIKPEELTGLNQEKFESKFNDSMSICFTVINGSEEKLLLKYVTGSSGCNKYSRFSSENPSILHIQNECIRKEADLHPEKITAEIVHLPGVREGNILAGGVQRNYEIPFVCPKTNKQSSRVLLKDLSIQYLNGKLVLWCQKREKEIIPKFSNSYNFHLHKLPVFQFLCDLQFQHIIPSLRFDWGTAKNLFTFLPRVEIENVIVHPATWQLNAVDYQELLQHTNESRDCVILKWLEERNIPRKFFLVDEDQELFFDFTKKNLFHADMLYEELKKKKPIQISEVLTDLGNAFLHDQEGHEFQNEFIGTIISNQTAEHLPFRKTQIEKRDFLPGEDWLYFDIYCSSISSNKILLEVINPICSNLKNRNLIDKWFFIRYADPNYHLRVRLKLKDKKNIDELIWQWNTKMIPTYKSGLISDCSARIYKREIERYGSDSIDLTESLFCLDSERAIKILSMISNEEHGEMMLAFCVCSMDSLLNAFMLSTAEKIHFLNVNIKIYEKSVRLNKKKRKELNSLFRKKKGIIADMIGSSTKNPSIQEFKIQLQSFDLACQVQINDLIKALPNDGIRIHSYISDIVHMNLNRLLILNDKNSEHIVYVLLHKFLVSDLARIKYSPKI